MSGNGPSQQGFSPRLSSSSHLRQPVLEQSSSLSSLPPQHESLHSCSSCFSLPSLAAPTPPAVSSCCLSSTGGPVLDEPPQHPELHPAVSFKGSSLPCSSPPQQLSPQAELANGAPRGSEHSAATVAAGAAWLQHPPAQEEVVGCFVSLDDMIGISSAYLWR